MTRWISCRTGAMKSPRRSTDSLAAGARKGVATYDRLEGGQSKGSVYDVAAVLGSRCAAALVRALVLAPTAASLGYGRDPAGTRAMCRVGPPGARARQSRGGGGR